MHDVVRRLAATRERNRDEVAGLSAQRADSIVGGGIAIETFMEFVRADEVMVSGQGVREGIALSLLRMAVAPTDEVKEATLSSLVRRFDGWDPDAAVRRRATAAALARGDRPEGGRDDGRGARPRCPSCSTSAAASTSSIGMDMWRTCCSTTELDGFTHQEIALASAVVRLAGDRHADPRRLGSLLRRPIGRCTRPRRRAARAGRRNRAPMPARPAHQGLLLGRQGRSRVGAAVVVMAKPRHRAAVRESVWKIVGDKNWVGLGLETWGLGPPEEEEEEEER